MPRALVLGNGSLLVSLDGEYRIRDLYYPHVGKENHVGGEICRFGLFTEGRFTWIESSHGWRTEIGYEPDTLVSRVECLHEDLAVRLVCTDAVDFHAALLVRRIEVQNLAPRDREIRLYFHQDLRISESEVGDTAAYDPGTSAVVHYKGSRYFLCNVAVDGRAGVKRWATGQKDQPGKEGTWRDAEDDGDLGCNPIAQGAVDSVVAAHAAVRAGGAAVVHAWIAVGPTWRGNWDSVADLDAKVVRRGPDSFIQRTRDYWKLWVGKEPLDFFDLPARVIDLYRRSLLVLRTQIDNEGAIIAANDSDIIRFNRDTYSYMWPRDGALAAHALDLAGYPEPAVRFYELCADLLTSDGYLLHKYTPDRALGSSWHPWYEDGRAQLPIQEDETALVLWALWKHFRRYRDIEDLRSLYGRFVRKAAGFMAAYRDPATLLPRESYDLWEERRGVHAFTCAAVVGGLHAAAELAACFGETEPARRFEQAAREVRAGMDRHLWRPDLGRFARTVRFHADGSPAEIDGVLDASLWGLFAFGAYPADDERVVSTLRQVRDKLWCRTAVGGLARYEDDRYQRVSEDPRQVPGNPWFVCTLWLAQHATATARGAADLARAAELLDWAATHQTQAGLLAEQIHPHDGTPLSVAPLTWSHATVVAAVQGYLDRCEALELAVPGTGERFRKLRSLELPEPAIG